MNERIQAYLFDIQDSAKAIQIFLDNKPTFDQFMANRMLFRAVEREFLIIGEAISRILKLEPNFPITDAREIVDFRNEIVHGYDGINYRIVWEIISNNLPKLIDEVEALLREA